MKIRAEYRKKGYSISDAVHPKPNHGKRFFTVDTDDLGTTDMAEIKEAASQTAPEGYELFKCEAA